MEQVGLKDQPIYDIADESLGITEYAEVLTDFVKNCDTPLTIALQGDWGSGKTSLMNLIDNSLDENNVLETDKYLTVWFNTWQYSQFNMSDTIALSMMSRLINKIRESADLSDKVEIFNKLEKGIKKISKAIAISGASLIGQADTLKEGISYLENENVQTEDPAVALEELKSGLEEVVKQATSEDTSFKKIVIFVDDLDRLVPIKAIELLESMKIFLDIERCVFIIACDYGVVVTGLKTKFGIAEGELKGKSFFDKIIQVPFKMPVRRYNPDSYIDKLLRTCGIPFEESDIGIYRDLVEYSVGFNPRTMKRLLNSLKLLTILDHKKITKQPNHSINNDDKLIDYMRQSSRIIFGTLCLLEEYEPLYDYITNNLGTKELKSLQKGFGNKDVSDFDNLRNDIGTENLEKAIEFLDTFIDSIQLDEDEEISNVEIENLEKMFSHSSLISSGTDREEFVGRDFALDIRAKLNQRYRVLTRSKSPKYGNFRMRQGEVYLYPSKTSDVRLSIRGYDDYFCFGVIGSSQVNVKKIGDSIRKKLNRRLNSVFIETVDGMSYYDFLKLPKDEQNIVEFEKSLFEFMDGLKHPVNTLRQLFKL